MNLTELKAKALEAKRLADAATEGPWTISERFAGIIEEPQKLLPVASVIASREIDAPLIAASRTLVPELADAVLQFIELIDSRVLKMEDIVVKEKLAIATEALNFYAYEVDWLRLDVRHGQELRKPAREALAKIEEVRESATIAKKEE